MARDPLLEIEELETRLDRYHEWLEQAVAERDRLALDAAWGVHYGLYASLATIAGLALCYVAIDRDTWLFAIAGFVVLTVPNFLIFAWSNRLRMEETERLAQLPEWRGLD